VRIDRILHHHLGNDLMGIHAARVRTTFDGAVAALRGGRASLTSIGRAIAVGTTHKHGIKRADRLLGNDKLWAERRIFFRAVARRLIPNGSRPVIIVDWTGFSTTLWSLVAAVSFEGRAIIIYSESHPIAQYNTPSVNRRFLRHLKTILPEGCTPIITTDAGFRSPWMREVSSLGWDYICRLRGLNRVRKHGTTRWSRLSRFATQIGRGMKEFGQCEAGLRARHVSRIVGFAGRLGCRWKNKWNGAVKTEKAKARRSAKEPWILATSLNCSVRKVVQRYRLRMQIEQTFRDTKSSRFGLSMDLAHTRRPRRVDVLMLLTCLAHVLSVILGLVAETLHLHRHYQANTLRRKRALSLSLLGRFMATEQHRRNVTPDSTNSAWQLLAHRAAASWVPAK
jgi:hypothetical protein